MYHQYSGITEFSIVEILKPCAEWELRAKLWKAWRERENRIGVKIEGALEICGISVFLSTYFSVCVECCLCPDGITDSCVHERLTRVQAMRRAWPEECTACTCYALGAPCGCIVYFLYRTAAPTCYGKSLAPRYIPPT